MTHKIYLYVEERQEVFDYDLFINFIESFIYLHVDEKPIYGMNSLESYGCCIRLLKWFIINVICNSSK